MAEIGALVRGASIPIAMTHALAAAQEALRGGADAKIPNSQAR